MNVRSPSAVALLALALLGCSSSSDSTDGDTALEQQVVQGVHDTVLAQLRELTAAAKQLEAAAPLTHGRGWDAAKDAKALTSMKSAWVRARSAYERIEGATAPLFPDIDASIDARYDDVLGVLGPDGDAYLFDDKGVTGLHAAERILYADVTPPSVVDFEETLTGYVPAAFPSTEKEARDFKQKLCAKIVSDAEELEAEWTPSHIDLAGSFQGLVSLMNEQREKVEKAASQEEESRYSQRTMANLRDNLAGTRTVYGLFAPWLRSKTNAKNPSEDGPTIDARIEDGFRQLDDAYGRVKGAAIPEPPETWSAEHPSAADLATPFGRLFTLVEGAVDPAKTGSVVDEMNDAAGLFGFPPFVVAH